MRRRINLRRIVLASYFASFAIFVSVGFSPVFATKYEISGNLTIPAINLETEVTDLELENNHLETPDSIVGSFASARNKTFLIGHASTVFQNLYKIHVGDIIEYNEVKYVVKNTTIMAKSEINMQELLKASDNDTLIIMTCSGEDLGGGDATHRLILTAEGVQFNYDA